MLIMMARWVGGGGGIPCICLLVPLVAILSQHIQPSMPPWVVPEHHHAG